MFVPNNPRTKNWSRSPAAAGGIEARNPLLLHEISIGIELVTPSSGCIKKQKAFIFEADVKAPFAVNGWVG
jgi:hypothetical protein